MTEQFDAKAAREGNARDILARVNIAHMGVKIEVNVQWCEKDGTALDDSRRASAVQEAVNALYPEFSKAFGLALVQQLATRHPDLCRGKNVVIDKASRPS